MTARLLPEADASNLGTKPSSAESRGQGWEIVDSQRLRDPATAAVIRTLMSECGDLQLLHDPVWLAGSSDVGSLGNAIDPGIAFLLHREGRLIGYAPFTRGTRTLRFGIGELTLHRRRLPSLTLVDDIILAAVSEAERADLICELFRTLAGRLQTRQALFLEGIPTESVLLTTASRLGGSGWVAIPLGQSYEHHFADLPPSFSEYERQMGRRSQKSLRYSQRKLSEHLGGAVRARRFASREDVPEFVASAQAISRKTYQWKLLGLGLRDTASLTVRLTLAAEHDWMRCYILYCGEEAVAFMLGYLYRGVYHYMDVGYDPDWAKWSVGSILQMQVMKDLLDGEDRPDRFDFSTGTGTHKARFGNVAREEINLLLLRRSLYNDCVARLYSLTAAIDRRAAAVAEALGIKAWIKKWLRGAA